MATAQLNNNSLIFTSDGSTSLFTATPTANKVTFSGSSAGTKCALSNIAEPSASTDASTKNYVDSQISTVSASITSQLNGLAWKAPCRAASTAAVTLATDFEAGDSLDGVTLVAGDRILIKDQASKSENGIYVVQSSGAPARSADADAAGELDSATVSVAEGSVNANRAYTQTAESVTPGSSSMTWVQFNATTFVAGDGMALSSNTFSVNTDNSTLEINSDTLRIKAGGVGSSALASSSVQTAAVADDAITQAKIAANAVDATALADSSVTTSKIGTLTSLAVSGNCSATAFIASSDRNLKENIRKINPSWALASICQVDACSYNFKGCDEPRSGVIAQQVAAIPGLEHLAKYNDKVQHMQVNYTDMTAHLIGAIQALSKRCAWLEAKVDKKPEADLSHIPDSMLDMMRDSEMKMHVEGYAPA